MVNLLVAAGAIVPIDRLGYSPEQVEVALWRLIRQDWLAINSQT